MGIFLTVNSEAVCLLGPHNSNKLPGDTVVVYWSVDHILNGNILDNFPLEVSNRDKCQDRNTKETIAAV